MKIEKQEKIDIGSDMFVKLKTCGNVSEIKYNTNPSHGGCTRKLDADTYENLKTGEILEFNHHENRASDKYQLARTMEKLRDLINTNVVNVECCRWLTLTYRENMRDSKKLYHDFRNCVKRLRAKFGKFEYIAVVEPQERGAWHLHCIFIFDGKAPYMPNEVVADCWKKGFVNVKALDSVDNVGAYLTAYLCDIQLSDDDKNNYSDDDLKVIKIDHADGSIETKRYLKGGRMHLYPPKFNLYRISKGIKQPVIEEMTYGEAKQKVSSAKLTFCKTINISDCNSGYSTTLQKEYYNKLRR